MKCMGNNKGFALITALMITMLSLVIVLGILYVVSQGIKTSASRKVYRNAIEAAYGGTNVAMYEIIPQLATAILEVSAPSTNDTNTRMTTLVNTFSGIQLQFPSTADCLNQKLLNDSSGINWSACSSTSKSVKVKDIKDSPDMTFRLQGASGSSFNVYSRIVDTIPGTTYMPPPPGGQPLLGGGAVEPGAAAASAGRHFIYRIEVIGEKAGNTSEQGNISVMYEY